MFKEKVNARTDGRTHGRTDGRTHNGPWHKLTGLRPVELTRVQKNILISRIQHWILNCVQCCFQQYFSNIVAASASIHAFCSSFNQYSVQYSFQATGCFPTYPLSKLWTAMRGEWILSQWPSSILGKNIARAGNRTSHLFSSPQHYQLSYGAWSIASNRYTFRMHDKFSQEIRPK